jgi:hypothetical protein
MEKQIALFKECKTYKKTTCMGLKGLNTTSQLIHWRWNGQNLMYFAHLLSKCSFIGFMGRWRGMRRR